jgi:glyceraldehyde-3-phosphate dehydrogenase type II
MESAFAPNNGPRPVHPMAKIVHVVGTGTIGEPLIALFADKAKELGIDEVTFNKRTPQTTDRSKIQDLIRKGAKLATGADVRGKFEELGMKVSFDTEEAIKRATVVIDCTPEGAGMENKAKFYSKYDAPGRGFMAQGSEFGFGKPYARWLNESAVDPATDRFTQIVSCNTHNISAVVNAVALVDGKDNLVEGSFLCIRRASDVYEDKSLGSPEVGSHKDERFGTHHARDVHNLYTTLGLDLKLFSSAIKVPTQYMHTLYFDIRVKKAVTKAEIQKRFQTLPGLSVTFKKSANSVFAFGRDHGYMGRLLNQTVLAQNTVAVLEGGKRVVGYCFTPQDGNSLLSSVAMTMRYLYPKDWEAKMAVFDQYLFREV